MPDPDARVWSDVMAHLRKHHPALCRNWFDEIESLGVAGGVMRLRAQSVVHRDYLQRQCLEPFTDAVRAVTGHLISVRFAGPEDSPEESYAEGLAGGIKPPAPDQSPARFRDALVINPDNTFDHFVIGPGNRMAHAAAIAVADNPGKAYNPLFIHGGVGLGKTHLLQAVCLQILHARAGTALYYISCDGFMTQYFEAVQAGQMATFRHRFRDVDVLVIDDIHFLAKRERSQEEFFHTFNTLYQAGKQIILSSDAAPEEIPHLEERLVSRFKQGMVAQVEAPDFETRVTIVKQKSTMRGLSLSDDVAFHIATCIDANIRELEGAITKLQLQSIVDGRPPDLAMAKSAIGDPTARTGNSDPTIHTIIAAVTDFYGVRLTDLQSKRRHRSVTLPRQICMYLARHHTRHSLEEIGGHFGGRDHTTVMHSIKAVESKRQTDKAFDGEVSTLAEKLRRTNP
jgi:chromosomal replication initiator protein